MRICYQSNDGKTFSNKEDCLNHEENVERLAIEKRLAEFRELNFKINRCQQLADQMYDEFGIEEIEIYSNPPFGNYYKLQGKTKTVWPFSESRIISVVGLMYGGGNDKAIQIKSTKTVPGKFRARHKLNKPTEISHRRKNNDSASQMD